MTERGAILNAVSTYYSDRLAEHGPNPRGVDWKDAESHGLRHRQFLRLLEGSSDASVLDVGCGYGDFLPFLRKAGHRGRYIGCDVAAPMIETARKLHGEGEDHAFLVGIAPEDSADFAIGSGILNVMRGASPAAWEEYVWATIDALHKACRLGFGFNMLSLVSDPERRRADLFYADPAAVLSGCVARYGRHIAVMQDYGLWEFTVVVRRG